MSALLTTSTRAPRAGGRASRPRGGGSALERDRRKLFLPFVGPALLFYTVLFVVPSDARRRTYEVVVN